MRKQIYRWLLILVWNMGLLTLGIVAAEAVYGRWFGTSILDDAYLLCDAHLEYEHDLFGAPVVTHYNKNHDCLRNAPANAENIDVLVVGGSTTDQRYIDDAETWDSVLHQVLTRTGVSLGFANAGIDGQTTIGHLWNFSNWFPRIKGLHPRYVLFYIGINDRLPVLSPRQVPPGLRVPGERLTDWAWREITKKSALYQAFATLEGIRAARGAKIGHLKTDPVAAPYTEHGLVTDWAPYEAYVQGPFADRLRRLVDEVRVLQATPIFVTQRTMFWKTDEGRTLGLDEEFSMVVSGVTLRYNGRDIHDMEQRISAVIIDTCRAAGALCIDGFTNLDFAAGEIYDFIHTTPMGARRIALFLASELRPAFASKAPQLPNLSAP
jgi:lysophospholipase L1-like esterase